MRSRLNCLITSLLVGLSCLGGSVSMASERSPGAGGPPSTYRLDEVSVRLTRQSGHGLPIRRVSLSGTGEATLERGHQSQSFRYEPKALLAVLNELYRIRFFDLPANYGTRQSIFLKDDGTVGTQVLRMSDASSTSICFSVADFEKCLRYGGDAPAELETLAQRIFADADRLVNPK